MGTALHWIGATAYWLSVLQTMRMEREIEERNRFLSDEELDAMLPTEGYKVLEPPAGCVHL